MARTSEYLKQLEAALVKGNATEHTHRPALKAFIESAVSGVTATNEPKREKVGAPDFIVTRGVTPLGYVEAKDVGASLDKAAGSEQLQRYLNSLDNLLLTDYLEFRWYVRGEQVEAARLGTFDSQRERLRVEPGGAETVEKLVGNFLTERVPVVGNPKELAERMARVARLIRGTILRAFRTEGAGGSLHEQLKGFRAVLLHDLDEEQFADMYAQTICYGLFAARCNARGGAGPFTRRHAAHDLPRTNPFLRKLFQHVAGPDLDDEPHAWAVDGLAELLDRTDIGAILRDFGRATRREDPVVHFYETFLAAYDPAMREARGVYYTPEPVVSYIVRSVDHILKTDFKLSDGLADASRVRVRDAKGKVRDEAHKVLILDPATGTGTFLYAVINHIFESFRQNRGMWSSYVTEHLLPRLFGFELLMAPYAVAHMKLGLQLAETGYEFNTEERLRVYLTNTLEEAHEVSRMPLFTQWLAEEANAASRIKQEFPVMVVLGNPPYSGESMNKSKWIRELINDYMYVDGKHLGEKGKKNWLQDDYVKFIRFAQWRIEQTGYGVMAFVTNHGYLDNPTFRGMRQSLMETFDAVYVLDLHGSSKKKERGPGGLKDENVFDIQQGVAIGIFIKKSGEKKRPAAVYHADLWGERELYEEAEGARVLSGGKYAWLYHNSVNTVEWQTIDPQSPFYLFIPQNKDLKEEYERGWKVSEMMPHYGAGIITSRDHFVIDYEDRPLRERLEMFRDPELSDIWISENLRINDNSMWSMAKARQNFRREPLRDDLFMDILYRPFDHRRIYYHTDVVFNMRSQIMDHMLLGRNIGLATTRSVEIGRGWEHVFCASQLVQHHSVSIKEVNSLFPLYLYPTSLRTNLFDEEAPGGRRANLAPDFVEELSGRLGMLCVLDGRGDLVGTFGPEDVFHYMYAVFHAPSYRARYAEFLKIDFPRLPVTSSQELFRALCERGARLVALHLLEEYAPPVAAFPVPGSNEVERLRYTAPDEEGPGGGRVWINREQYFEGVAPEVWEFHVGGYQVAAKWLKDRKVRRLAFDDLEHYRRVVAALAETIRLMADIDDVIEPHGWPLR